LARELKLEKDGRHRIIVLLLKKNPFTFHTIEKLRNLSNFINLMTD